MKIINHMNIFPPTMNMAPKPLITGPEVKAPM